MFDKLNQMKDLYALKKQADQIKKEMEQISTEVFEGNFKVVIRGDQMIEAVYENGEERKDLKTLFNKAVKESQKQMAKKMQGRMGEFGLPGM